MGRLLGDTAIVFERMLLADFDDQQATATQASPLCRAKSRTRNALCYVQGIKENIAVQGTC